MRERHRRIQAEEDLDVNVKFCLTKVESTTASVAVIGSSLQAIERSLDSLELGKLGDAKCLVADLEAILKLRKNVDSLRETCIRLSAKILWKIKGLVDLGPIKPSGKNPSVNFCGHELTGSEKCILGRMKRWNDSHFIQFMESIGFASSLYSQVEDFDLSNVAGRNQAVEAYRNRQREKWNKLDDIQREKVLSDIEKTNERMSRSRGQRELRLEIENAIRQTERDDNGFQLPDVVDSLASVLGIDLDADSEDIAIAAKVGLGKLVRDELNREPEIVEGGNLRLFMDRLNAPPLLVDCRIPRFVCYREYDKWNRISFEKSTTKHLSIMVNQRIEQANDLMDSARKLMRLSTFLRDHDENLESLDLEEDEDYHASFCFEILQRVFGKMATSSKFYPIVKDTVDGAQ